MATPTATPLFQNYYITNEPSQRDQTADHNSLQLDLQHLVELTNSIFEIAVASKDSTDDQSAKLYNMMSSLESTDGMRQALKDIRNISCEMSCNLFGGTGNMDETTSVVLEKLRKYSWSEQTVITVAAFAFSILELSMLVKHRDIDLMAKLVNQVKGHSLELNLKTLKHLRVVTETMMGVVRTSLAFSRDGVSQEESSAMNKAMTFLPEAANNIIRIVLKISNTFNQREKNIVDVDAELKRLATELFKINSDLQETLKTCTQHAAGKKAPNQYDPYEEVMKKPMPIISTSILIEKIKKYIKVQDCAKLDNKHVLYLVSDLDISTEEIKVLKGLYKRNIEETMYEIVWLPIVDSSAYAEKEEERFRELKQMMEWICVEKPLKKDEAAEVIEYIKKDWQYIKQAIAVSVNTGGEITSLNALPMLWTWGNDAFPFTESEERYLSKRDEQKGWSLNWLFNEIIIPDDMDIQSWTNDQATFVCLFGGGDISWNQEFIEKVKYAAHVAGVALKLVYLGLGGKNKGKGLTRNELDRDIMVIQSESQWQFWSRLESILYTKIKLGKAVDTSEKDRVRQEALKLVGYSTNGESWAMFSMGRDATMVTANGETALTIMKNCDKWTGNYAGIRFLEGIKMYSKDLVANVHSCININLPIVGRFPGIMTCSECNKVMDMFYTYRCCVESRLC